MEVAIIPINTRKMAFSNWCYLIYEEENREAILIDPAWDYEKIDNLIQSENLTLKAILITHSHYDHINLVDFFCIKYSPQVYISHSELHYCNLISSLIEPLKDRQRIRIGNIEIECLLTPGHTSGSMCYLINKNLFTGDTMFIEGCGICSTESGSASDMFYTFQLFEKYISRDTKIYPGHVYDKPVGQLFDKVLQYNVYFAFSNVDDFIAFRMRKNQKNLFSFI